MSRWLPYVEFPEHYLVSEAGNIKSIKSGKIIKQQIWKNYRKKVWLYIDGVRFCRYTHRMVALTFIPNPLNLAEVNHIDGNRYNNKLSNLEWMDEDENKAHAKLNGLHNNPAGKRAKNLKGVVIAKHVTKKKKIILYGKMQIESAGFLYNSVLKVIAGKQQSHRDFKFTRKEVNLC
ncbi:HNH homing endonuclease [Alishewanella phage vB_AspM_Slicko01]|nr:HNH homing endonuclease [Alishewanella phage vB_AspM_Slicko01]